MVTILSCVILVPLLILCAVSLTTASTDCEVSHYNEIPTVLGWMNESADPCEDFAMYSCGQFYSQAASSPGSRPFIRREMSNRNSKRVKELISESEKPWDWSITKQMKRFYNSCMNDTRKADNSTYFLSTPHAGVWPSLRGGNWTPSAADWPDKIIEMTRQNHVDLLFAVTPNANHRLVLSTKGQLLVEELSSRTLTPPVQLAIKKYYKDLAVQLGADPQTAESDAAEVLSLELDIAQIKSTTIRSIQDVNGFSLFNGNFDMRRLVQATFSSANITIPSSQRVRLKFPQTYLSSIRTKLDSKGRRIVYNMFAFEVARKMVERSNQRMNEIYLSYYVAISDRLRTAPAFSSAYCVRRTAALYRRLVDRLFVDRHFPRRSLSDVETILYKIKRSFKGLVKYSWLTHTTWIEMWRKFYFARVFLGNGTELSTENLTKFYGNLNITKTDFVKNRWALRKVVNAIFYWGKYNAGSETRMKTSAVKHDIFYRHPANALTMTTGALQPPTYDFSFSRVYKYAKVGFLLAHELDHMIHHNHRDGQEYNSLGVQTHWVIPIDNETMFDKSECFKTQYNAMRHPVHQIAVNSDSLVWENMADFSGLLVANRVVKELYSETARSTLVPGTNLSLHKLFFVAYAQNWCSPNSIKEFQGSTFTHAPKYFRINGAVMNNPDFGSVFKCSANAPMNPTSKCSVW